MLTTTYHSPLGDMVLLASARGLCELRFCDCPLGASSGLPNCLDGVAAVDMRTGLVSPCESRHDAPSAGERTVCEQVEGHDAVSGGDPLRVSHPSRSAALAVLERTWAWLNAYFAGQPPLWMPPLCLDVNETVHAVCVEALSIPHGCTCAIDEFTARVSERLGAVDPCDVPAVLAALSQNPISIVIPTHRVIAVAGDSPAGVGRCGDSEFLSPRDARLRELETGASLRR